MSSASGREPACEIECDNESTFAAGATRATRPNEARETENESGSVVVCVLVRYHKLWRSGASQSKRRSGRLPSTKWTAASSRTVR